MAEISTDSYPKPPALPAQKTLLDQVGQYQNLEHGKLAIEHSKLKLMNDRWGIINKELSTMANDPTVTPERVAERVNNLSKMGLIPPQQVGTFLSTIQGKSGPALQREIQTTLERGQSNIEAMNWHYGAPGLTPDGQRLHPTLTTPKPGFPGGPVQRTGTPIQMQVPPTVQTIGTPGAPPQMLGPQPEQNVPLPVARPQQSQNLTAPGNTVISETIENLPVAGQPNARVSQGFNDTYGVPRGPVVGQTPLFEQGMKAYTEDQVNASARMMRAKPAIQAIPLMLTPGFLTGPLSEPFTKISAALKTFGLLETANENDPTAVRQEVSKKLAQYVQGNPVGARSDAAQILAEASSPNPKEHVLPALLKLTKDAVILDRVEAARANAFKDKDLSKYPQFRGKFPQSIDERAFGLDLDSEEKKTKFVDDMAKKLKSSNRREKNEAEKFFRSLQVAEEQGFYQ